ncbi:hypothetical protein HGM15179_009374 [Zosterops borbonicus]|uniref:Uncharacterized protein n=1 Tax=Zosterops borbonicus TaxID=364589 RepID=A0A8K1GFE2_9PASS|nr:hypothetical protein HGM15179_009374 [Zosterops borbonicus]
MSRDPRLLDEMYQELCSGSWNGRDVLAGQGLQGYSAAKTQSRAQKWWGCTVAPSSSRAGKDEVVDWQLIGICLGPITNSLWCLISCKSKPRISPLAQVEWAIGGSSPISERISLVLVTITQPKGNLILLGASGQAVKGTRLWKGGSEQLHENRNRDRLLGIWIALEEGKASPAQSTKPNLTDVLPQMQLWAGSLF